MGVKFSIPRLLFLQILSKIQSVVPLKPSLPIFNFVLLTAEKNKISLRACDLISHVSFSLDNPIEQGGKLALPAKKLWQLCKEITSPFLEIEEVSQDTTLLRTGSAVFKLSCANPEDFPAFPDLSKAEKLLIPQKTLKELLLRSSFAAAKDDNRQILNGILFHLLNSKACFIGTDGKRLARLQALLQSHHPAALSCVLPIKSVEEMIKLLSDEEDKECNLLLTEDKIAIELDSAILASKLLFGKYPDVDRVIPSALPSPIALHREELLSLLKQVSVFTTDAAQSISFAFQKGELKLFASSQMVGEGTVTMAIDYQGPNLTIAFNPQSFIDILRHIADEVVQLSVTDPYQPGLITDSTQAEFVIMPMRS